MQAVAAFPEKVGLFVEAGCTESLLTVLDHQNIDICLESVILLVELTDEEIANAQTIAIQKLLNTLIDNSVWNVLLKV